MIPKKYEGRPFVLCATGPSLTPEVVETIREFKDKFVIFGINDAYKIVDFLDEHYACDTRWWKEWGKDLQEKYPNLSCWTQCKWAAEEFKIQHIPGKHHKGLSGDPRLIHFGKNSGYQALNIAYLMGGSHFILVGYNMQVVQKSHFFGEHPPGLNKNSPYPTFIQAFRTIQPEIAKNIINCTTNTALTCFKQADLRETCLALS